MLLKVLTYIFIPEQFHSEDPATRGIKTSLIGILSRVESNKNKLFEIGPGTKKLWSGEGS